MRPALLVRRASDYLANRGVERPHVSAEALLASVIGTDRAGIFLRNEPLSAEQERRFALALRRRGAGTPLQHLTGTQGFRRLMLEVRPGVFVPRPETELLVDEALDRLRGLGSPDVVDVGTGSGAIALALAQEIPGARVLATDRSRAAVDLARDNADRLGFAVQIFEGDLLDPLPEGFTPDLVVSNPPYLEAADIGGLPPEVRADPATALVGGIGVHERLVRSAAGRLRSRGALVLEIGSTQARAVAALLEPRFEQVRVVRDLAGRDRIVSGLRR